jgi:hypothetical protein
MADGQLVDGSKKPRGGTQLEARSPGVLTRTSLLLTSTSSGTPASSEAVNTPPAQ